MDQKKNCYNNYVKLPSTIIIPYIENVNPLNILIDDVFPNIKEYPHNLDNIIHQVILTPRNDYVDEAKGLNNKGYHNRKIYAKDASLWDNKISKTYLR